MRGYEWGTGTVRCSFCNSEGHNITSCYFVESTAIHTLEALKNDPDYQPTYTEKRALMELKRREERKVKLKKAVRNKPKCSFCRQSGHKRNKCDKLNDFKAHVLQANRNWRTAFVSHMNYNGYGIGSLIEMPRGMIDYWTAEGTAMGLVIAYKKEKLNLFCTIANGGEYYSDPSIEVLCEGTTYNVPISRLVGDFDEDIIGRRYTWNHYLVKSLGRSEAEVSENFYDCDDEEAFKWFFSKVSTKDRQWNQINDIVSRWLE